MPPGGRRVVEFITDGDVKKLEGKWRAVSKRLALASKVDMIEKTIREREASIAILNDSMEELNKDHEAQILKIDKEREAHEAEMLRREKEIREIESACNADITKKADALLKRIKGEDARIEADWEKVRAAEKAASDKSLKLTADADKLAVKSSQLKDASADVLIQSDKMQASALEVKRNAKKLEAIELEQIAEWEKLKKAKATLALRSERVKKVELDQRIQQAKLDQMEADIGNANRNAAKNLLQVREEMAKIVAAEARVKADRDDVNKLRAAAKKSTELNASALNEIAVRREQVQREAKINEQRKRELDAMAVRIEQKLGSLKKAEGRSQIASKERINERW